MIYDQSLVDQLGAAPVERFAGEVYRTTSVAANPLAPSTSGGRWAPPRRAGEEIAVLYTSLEREGSLAEVISYLTLLTPMPRFEALKTSRLSVSTAKTLRLARANLEELGVEMCRYGERDYARTQLIGAAAAFLEFDGLIAPSARWTCDNLMIFSGNHSPGEHLEAVDQEEIDWRDWARSHGFLPEPP